jgi:hypothetical protein
MKNYDLARVVPTAVFNDLHAGNAPTSSPRSSAPAVRALIGYPAVCSRGIGRGLVSTGRGTIPV